MPRNAILEPSPQGLYCAAGHFYVDPWGPVERAVITHGHSDHARIGMGEYYTTVSGLPILKWRLGDQNYHQFEYGEAFRIGGALISFHPAGHVLGSAQIRIEVDGEVWVVSGDYKRQFDPTSTPFEPVRCDTFITEATFALPVFRWPEPESVMQQILDWWKECESSGDAAILYVYALGKAQRILAELKDIALRPIMLHGAISSGVDVYRRYGIEMADTQLVADKDRAYGFAGDLILAPPSAAGSSWLRRFPRAQQAFASGWMQIRGNKRRRNLDRGFVVSDHVDWDDLLQSIEETGAKRVIATHGDSYALVRYLTELNTGILAESMQTEFGADQDEE